MKQGADMADEPNFLGLFNRHADVVALKPGETLFKRGDPAQHMYVVLSGSLRVGDAGAELEQLSPGGMVGELALVDQGPRSATVTAISDCTLARIDDRRFQFLVQQTPNFALSVMRLMSRRLKRMTDKSSH
jgi:CRP/FNR family cyclic AMP-dependent transcriptional regulator